MKSSCLLDFCLFNAVGWTLKVSTPVGRFSGCIQDRKSKWLCDEFCILKEKEPGLFTFLEKFIYVFRPFFCLLESAQTIVDFRMNFLGKLAN